MSSREIEILRARISELETQLRRNRSPERNNTSDHGIRALRSQISDLERQPARRRSSQRSNAEYQHTFDSASLDAMSLRCKGFLTESTTGSARHFYGLSSLHNLVHRMKVYLYLAYGWVYVEENLHPRTITLSFASQSGLATSNYPATYQRPTDLSDGVFMGKAQEEECLRLFWQSYHCAIPVLNERRFQEHHSLLWSSHGRSDGYRDESALVDVILAICVQYGMTHIQRHRSASAMDTEYNIIDPSNAGRWYFQRGQSLLKAQLENPSLMLLQCQIFSVVYLRDASLLNIALSTVAAAIQTAYSLGLHLEVNEFSNTRERELCKRLWCMVFVLEGKMSMDCGRPFLAQTLGLQLPRDDHQLASESTELFVPYSRLRITWLTYHVQHVRLIQISREVFSKVYDHVAQLLASRCKEEFGQNMDLTRRCDEVLTQELSNLMYWLEGVPKELRYQSIASRIAEDRETSRNHLDQHTPLWLQRQRVMLRLLYHDILINLCRPFIIFSSPSNPTMSTPTKNAVECLEHSMAITDIAHQVLEETDILHGWHRAYQFQWDAALSMIAFAFGYSASPFIDSIVVKLEQAIAVLDAFGRCFAVASSATEIIRDLYGKLRSASIQH